MNGITSGKSRYLTLSAVIHTAGPMLATKASTTNPGRTSIRQPGRNRYHAISRASIAKVIRKSTNATITVAVGTISLGKYTLLIRLALLTRLLDASLRPVAKNVHGSIPAKTISG